MGVEMVKTVSSLSLLLSLLTFGCAGGRAAAASSGTWTLAVDKAVDLPEGGSVVLDKVEDSRCPIGVVCVWEGDATAHLTFRGGGAPDESITLSLNARSASAAHGLELRLVDVVPAPRAGTQIDPATYRATVEWRRP
jgi:hypothetical protein